MLWWFVDLLAKKTEEAEEKKTLLFLYLALC